MEYIFVIVLIIIGVYFILRNNLVFIFCTDVTEKVHYRLKHEIREDDSCISSTYITKKYNEYCSGLYHRALFSFKRLKLENFFTKEQIEWLINR